jgi:hypothetical protein
MAGAARRPARAALGVRGLPDGKEVALQRPQAKGDLDRKVFEGVIAPRATRFHVSRRKDGTWWLDAGAVHAVKPETELAVLRTEAGEGEDLSRRLGTVRVVRVVRVGAGSSRVGEKKRLAATEGCDQLRWRMGATTAALVDRQ